MLGLRSYVKYYGDKYIKGVIIGETSDKWLVEWNSFLWESPLVSRVDKQNSLIEITMCDEPVKIVGDRKIIESEYFS